jgi:hypothetical protein
MFDAQFVFRFDLEISFRRRDRCSIHMPSFDYIVCSRTNDYASIDEHRPVHILPIYRPSNRPKIEKPDRGQ